MTSLRAFGIRPRHFDRYRPYRPLPDERLSPLIIDALRGLSHQPGAADPGTPNRQPDPGDPGNPNHQRQPSDSGHPNRPSDPDPLRVVNGPFRGMAYAPISWGAALGPKLLGSYEEPIHGWVEMAVETGYSTIVNIGCAEGYYATGFALRCPATRVIGFDTHEPAIADARRIAALNGAAVEFRAERCTPHSLETLLSTDRAAALLFVDIEGGELELLDPVACPALTRTDMIVEAHDCFIPGITDALIKRFRNTHAISIHIDTPFRWTDYSGSGALSRAQVARLTNESRPEGMSWIRLLAP